MWWECWGASGGGGGHAALGCAGRTGVRPGGRGRGAPCRGSRCGRCRAVCVCAPFTRRGTDSKSNTPRRLRRGRPPEGADADPPAARGSQLSSRSLPASPKPATGGRGATPGAPDPRLRRVWDWGRLPAPVPCWNPLLRGWGTAVELQRQGLRPLSFRPAPPTTTTPAAVRAHGVGRKAPGWLMNDRGRQKTGATPNPGPGGEKSTGGVAGRAGRYCGEGVK